MAVRSNPVRKALYPRLRAAGKVAQVARRACMRTLLIMLKALVTHQTPWQPQEGGIAAEEKRVLDNQDRCSARASLWLLARLTRRVGTGRGASRPVSTIPPSELCMR